MKKMNQIYCKIIFLSVTKQCQLRWNPHLFLHRYPWYILAKGQVDIQINPKNPKIAGMTLTTWGRLNIKMPPYQYSVPIIKIRRSLWRKSLSRERRFFIETVPCMHWDTPTVRARNWTPCDIPPHYKQSSQAWNSLTHCSLCRVHILKNIMKIHPLFGNFANTHGSRKKKRILYARNNIQTYMDANL